MPLYVADVLRRDGARVYAEFLGKASGTALAPVVAASTLPQMLLIMPSHDYFEHTLQGATLSILFASCCWKHLISALSDTARLYDYKRQVSHSV